MNNYFLQVYGCQMNQYEAGIVRAVLNDAGYVETAREDEADVLLMLTCAVRSHAERRALGRLGSFRALARRRPDGVVAVLGCMSQNLKDILADERAADLIAGPDAYRHLPELITAVRTAADPVIDLVQSDETYAGIRPETNHAVCGLVTVMRGCDNHCAYCVVPFTRGPARSRPLGQILAEVERLVGRGVRDVTLLGQNVLAYRGDGIGFPELLERVARTASEARIRFLTSHPRDLDQVTLETVARLPNVCPALHLPLQTGSDRILRLMNRHYTRSVYLEKIELARRLLPGLGLTTDIIVGFPSETEDDFRLTLDTVRQVRFDSACMFRYSSRPGTAAERIEPKVPEDESGRRLSRLIDVQNRITRELSNAMVGREYELLIEGPAARGTDMLGRTRSNKTVVVKGPAAPGRIVVGRVARIRGWTPVAETIAPALVSQ